MLQSHHRAFFQMAFYFTLQTDLFFLEGCRSVMCQFRLLLSWSCNGAECIQSWWVASPPSSQFWQSSLFSLESFFLGRALGIYLSGHLSSAAPLSRQTTCELCSAIFTSSLPSMQRGRERGGGEGRNQQMELFTFLWWEDTSSETKHRHKQNVTSHHSWLFLELFSNIYHLIKMLSL